MTTIASAVADLDIQDLKIGTKLSTCSTRQEPRIMLKLLLKALHSFAYKLDSVEIRHYVTGTGRDPYQQWLDGLKDLKGRVIIQRRIDRVATGNFGDHRFFQDGVWELRIDYGPGVLRAGGRDGGTFAVWRIKAVSVG
jgi:hypothetical protein